MGECLFLLCQCRTHLFLKPPHLRNVPGVGCRAHPCGRACRFFFLFLAEQAEQPAPFLFLFRFGAFRHCRCPYRCRLLQSGQVAFQQAVHAVRRGRHIHHPPDQPAFLVQQPYYRVYPCRLCRLSVVAFQPVYHFHRVRFPPVVCIHVRVVPQHCAVIVQKQCDQSPVCFAGGGTLHEQAAFLCLRLLEHLLFVPYCRDDAQYEQSQYEIARQDFQVEGFLPS